jgi:hypothetical protein
MAKPKPYLGHVSQYYGQESNKKCSPVSPARSIRDRDIKAYGELEAQMH